MSTVIDSLERAQLRRVPTFDAGDRLRVHFQVIEGTRRRTQVFEGVVIKRQGHGARETFTVRKQSFGVGVERTFPLHSPKIERIEVAARGDVRRAKLYYLRGRVGKRARVRERRSTGPEEFVERELLYAPEPEEALEDSAAGEAVEPAEDSAAGEAAEAEEAPSGSGKSPLRRLAEPEPEVVAEAEPEAAAPRRPASNRRRRKPALPMSQRPPSSLRPRPGPHGRRIGVIKKKKSAVSSVVELVVIVAIAIGLALAIQAFVVKPYRIPSGSMLPTLHIGQRVLVDRIGTHFCSPQVGDIIVFHPPKNYAAGCANPSQGENGVRPGRAAAVRCPAETGIVGDVHQARGRSPRRSDLDPQRPRDPQRQAREGLLHHPLRRQRLVQLSRHDHDSPRRLLHDG